VKPLRVLLAAALLGSAALAGGALASTTPTSGVLCPSDDGRQRLTADTTRTFEAPAATAPELSATRAVTGEAVTTFREAKIPLLVDAAPSTTITLGGELVWKRPADFDLYVLDSKGSVLANADSANLEEDTLREEFSGLKLKHCDEITVVARSWAAPPTLELFLTLSVTPGKQLLSCVANDPAPGCAGKAAGEAPAKVADPRTRLYLGGDPGQASMAWSQTGNEELPLPKGRLLTTEPTSGTPNSYTRPVLGFRNQYRNPFVAHFTGTLPTARAVKGTAEALVWVSSPTLASGGTLVADLYLDDGLVGSVNIPGTAVGTTPTPVRVSFPGLKSTSASRVVLQLATEPAASSNGPGNPADAAVTVHYGAVQFPSRITLP
jgi:hypothetical protein